ncbi:hypothetical protein PGTUg99_016676 [Puccinia graminis f. sp. tritici]|uniref:Uncharacterized protein n=1 Tax=Puccinia graminis f. sp. tritici TaxID=56615 RepID=A0A5B0RUA5_PUCGR|nr:hypothetical protein PGTUg99_016676 [Puccinia graminis f. sp. tritici]
MAHTCRNTNVPLTIPNFLARVTPPRQTTAGRPSVTSTIPFPSDSPLFSLSNSTTAQFRSFSYDMPGSSKSGTPSNPNSPGADDPNQENATSIKEVAKDKGNANESQQPPPFNPTNNDFKNFQGNMLRLIFKKFITQGTPSSLPL